jgi:hypothetical protein
MARITSTRMTTMAARNMGNFDVDFCSGIRDLREFAIAAPSGHGISNFGKVISGIVISKDRVMANSN